MIPGSLEFTMRVSIFGDLVFEESAGIRFECALDACHSEAAVDHPEAWLIDERRIAIELAATLSLESADELRRFLDVLAIEAIEGEVVMVREGMPRWTRVAGPESGRRPHASKPRRRGPVKTEPKPRAPKRSGAARPSSFAR
jgi:hypothetical protein